MITKIEIKNSDDAVIALDAVLKWAERAHPALAILLRRCILRLHAAALLGGIH